MRVIKFGFKSIWRTIVVLTPLLGVWLASSLAAHFGGPRWTAIAAGVLLFPLVPFAWEAWATRRKKTRDAKRVKKGKEPRKAWMTTLDRVVLRTLAVNFTFIGALVALFPQAVFPALSTRGAWFLDDIEGPVADAGRMVAFASAAQLEWLYRMTDPNPYAGLGEGEAGADVDSGEIRPGDVDRDVPDDVPDDKKPDDKKPDDKKPDDKKPDDKKPDDKKPDDKKPGDKKPGGKKPGGKKPGGKKPGGKKPARTRVAWPATSSLHPMAKSAPAGPTTTIASLGSHFRAIKNQRSRIRAMHDWVATHISYDLPAIDDGTYPHKQSAERVLKDRRGVCSGYSNLMSALGKKTGDRIVYLTGYTRDDTGEIPGPNGHAWNAVEIDGAWYLMDITWDSGNKIGRKTRPMRTTYFLTPPDAFALDHFPDEKKWQLLRTPMTRGDFLRQPPMDPISRAYGIEIVSPDTGRGVSTSSRPSLKFANPKKYFLIGNAVHQSGREVKCDIVRAKTSEVNCPLKQKGRYQVKVFANAKEAGTYAFMGSVIVDQK